MEKDIKQLKEDYPALKMWSDSNASIIYNDMKKEELITEFNYTVEPNKTIEQLLKQIKSGITNVTTMENKLGAISRICVTISNARETYVDELNAFMFKFGWYPAIVADNDNADSGKYSTLIGKSFNNKSIEICYEPKHDVRVDVSDLKYLYHITPDIKYHNIQGFGLSPKEEGKLADHPGRIYFFTNRNTDIGWLAKVLLSRYKNRDLVNEMFLLAIDIDKIPNHKFYYDSNFMEDDAVFTYENIPPSAIKLVEKIKI